MAFELEPQTALTEFVLYILHDVSIASGLLAIWFSGDTAVKWFMKKKWFVWATSFSFIIYALHVPLIHYATRLAFIYLRSFANYRLLTYFIIPVFILLFCIAAGAVFRRLWPKGYRVATGGRGF